MPRQQRKVIYAIHWNWSGDRNQLLLQICLCVPPPKAFFLIISSLFVTVGILLYSVMCQWKRQLLELNVVLGSSNCRVHQKTYQHFCTLHLLEVSQIQLKLPIVTTYTPRFNTWCIFWQKTEAECWNLHSSTDWGDSGFASYRIFGIKEANCVSYIQKFWYLRVGVLWDVIWVMASRTCFPFLTKFHSLHFDGSSQAMNYWTVML